ncbi:hypothetical protein CH063_10572 [Colletotrichum higginsianum]|uniref:Uncharacterized protein n=1 Tax=Colletotrichum higginsianum (strain IMI 349063) TaxID=759273 RepID=H1VHZ7_COLHI|nr:hypothetical protein CH063_10572 [Colletotrichum higginsianum]
MAPRRKRPCAKSARRRMKTTRTTTMRRRRTSLLLSGRKLLLPRRLPLPSRRQSLPPRRLPPRRLPPRSLPPIQIVRTFRNNQNFPICCVARCSGACCPPEWRQGARRATAITARSLRHLAMRLALSSRISRSLDDTQGTLASAG